MSIQKIARLAGVSVATVSRVLNNQGSVKQKNREKVLLAIKESNYQPNLLARQLRTAKSKMLLVLVSNIANPFCADVVKGIEAEAERNGYHILLCDTDSNLERSQSSLVLLAGKMVDGVITMDALSNLPGLAALIGNSPWVQCAEYADITEVSSVGIDDRQAAHFAIKQFIKQKRQRIAMINHDLHYKYAKLREQGYREILNEHSFGYLSVAYATELSYLSGRDAMCSLLNGNNKPDAVFTVSDILAVGALRAIQDSGLKVPEDIALIGFDGMELCNMTTPQLSTIQQPTREIGRRAVNLLIEKIENPDSPPQKTILDWSFIQRESS
ncbi:TPA: LacI family DNA-binding transcriptional regulator [Klebsiella pneumoniae]|nr:LacI family DNA-binding transcriptional regulator [Klebsiella pneumoniae]